MNDEVLFSIVNPPAIELSGKRRLMRNPAYDCPAENKLVWGGTVETNGALEIRTVAFVAGPEVAEATIIVSRGEQAQAVTYRVRGPDPLKDFGRGIRLPFEEQEGDTLADFSRSELSLRTIGGC